MVGCACRAQGFDSFRNGLKRPEPFETLLQPAFVEQCVELVLEIQGPPQKVSTRYIAGIPKEPGGLRPNTRQRHRAQSGLNHSAQGLWDIPPEPHELGYLAERWIPAKQLVATHPRERHLEPLHRGRAADEIGVEPV